MATKLARYEIRFFLLFSYTHGNTALEHNPHSLTQHNTLSLSLLCWLTNSDSTEFHLVTMLGGRWAGELCGRRLTAHSQKSVRKNEKAPLLNFLALPISLSGPVKNK